MRNTCGTGYFVLQYTVQYDNNRKEGLENMSLRDLIGGGSSHGEEQEAATALMDAPENADGIQDEITTDMLIVDIIKAHPIAAQFLMDCGMECIFCPASQQESLEQACAVHGIDAEEICAALNERIESYRT